MTPKPILFSGPMVRALLDGRKMQTRRLLKPQPFLDGLGNFCAQDRRGKVWNWGQNIDGSPCLRNYIAREVKYRGGDVLWVKETWAVATIYDGMRAGQINPGGRPGWCGIRYAADGPSVGIKNRPAIFCPRWASRLTLAVTDVRVQRLQEISEADAWAEGCKPGILDVYGQPFPAEEPDPSGIGHRGWEFARDWYADLWEEIHGDGAWDRNPWVVALTFDVHRMNVDEYLARQEAA